MFENAGPFVLATKLESVLRGRLRPGACVKLKDDGLSSVILYMNGRRLSSHWFSIGHILVAGGAQHQRFAFPRRHDAGPMLVFLDRHRS